jgi:imidazole glycerol-phosphate synthase subunit HisH
VIVDYGLGNLRSVAGAVERLGYVPQVTARPEDIEAAEKLVLPGVGAFGDGMRNLAARGLIEPLTRAVVGRRTPVIGICLGAQLMARRSHELGVHEGLGWIDAVVDLIDPVDPELRVPHVGWNELRQRRDDPLFKEIPQGSLFYFVHSYHIQCATDEVVLGDFEYGRRLTAVIRRDNICGTQFHPEKSQLMGLRLLGNFLAA